MSNEDGDYDSHPGIVVQRDIDNLTDERDALKAENEQLRELLRKNRELLDRAIKALKEV